MSNCELFYSDEFNTLRTFDEDNEILLAATDVAKALGYRDSYALTRNLFDDEKGTHNVGTLGGNQQLSVITEAGLYHALTLRRSGAISDEEQRQKVERFQRWVTHSGLKLKEC